jgi:hypothetical protein
VNSARVGLYNKLKVIYRNIANELERELITKYKAPDIVNVINIRRMEWLGHVVRMNETRSVKKIFEGKLDGRRGRGRPRLRWINDVEDD